jgi:pilus assembly protein Flp/PilA
MLFQALSLLKVYFSALDQEEGQGMVEYALIIALVAVLLIAALGFVQGGVENVFTAIQDALGGGS